MSLKPHDIDHLRDLDQRLGDILDDGLGADEVEPVKPLYMVLHAATEGNSLTEEPKDDASAGLPAEPAGHPTRPAHEE